MKAQRLIFLFVVFVGIAYAVGTYFLLDEFTTPDAAPLTDPITTSGGQSVDVVDVEGIMSVSGGVLSVPAQASVANGEEGLRYATAIQEFAGNTVFFKVKFSTLANSAAGGTNENNGSAVFGFTGNATVGGGTNVRGAVRVNSANFLWPFAENTTNAMVRPTLTLPTTTDSFYIAIGFGGRDGGDDQASVPWYLGVNPSGYTDGAFLWIKKNVVGNWLLQGCGNDEHDTNQYAFLSNLNAAYTVDRWAVSNDTLRSLMQPSFYHSGTGTNGTQVFDDTPEVGAAFDSARGNWVFNASNEIVATGADPAGNINYLVATDTGDDEVYAEALIKISGAGQQVAIVLRYNPVDSSCWLINCSNETDLIRIQTYEGGTLTTRASVSTSIGTTDEFVWMGAAIQDSTVRGWVFETATLYTATYTHTANLNAGITNHGLRTTTTTTESKAVRIYSLGTDGEYNNTLNQYFPDLVAAASSSDIIRRMLPYGHQILFRPFGH